MINSVNAVNTDKKQNKTLPVVITTAAAAVPGAIGGAVIGKLKEPFLPQDVFLAAKESTLETVSKQSADQVAKVAEILTDNNPTYKNYLRNEVEIAKSPLSIQDLSKGDLNAVIEGDTNKLAHLRLHERYNEVALTSKREIPLYEKLIQDILNNPKLENNATTKIIIGCPKDVKLSDFYKKQLEQMQTEVDILEKIFGKDKPQKPDYSEVQKFYSEKMQPLIEKRKPMYAQLVEKGAFTTEKSAEEFLESRLHRDFFTDSILGKTPARKLFLDYQQNGKDVEFLKKGMKEILEENLDYREADKIRQKAKKALVKSNMKKFAVIGGVVTAVLGGLTAFFVTNKKADKS